MIGKVLQDFSNSLPDKIHKRFNKNIEVAYNEYTSTIIGHIVDGIRKEQTKWQRDIKKRISSKIPKDLLHKKRPQSREFPYKVTGEMYEAVLTDIDYSKVDRDSYKVRADFMISSKHAYFTNYGISGRVGSRGKWVGWATRSFTGGGGIKSASDRIAHVLGV